MCEGYTIDFQLSFQEINGTKKAVLIPYLKPCPEDPTPIIVATFLSLIFLVAFLLNLLVVVTVATSYTLKRYIYCHLLINLSAVCMLDCFFNISIAIAYVTTAPWRFGYYLNYFNSFTMNVINSEMAFAVLLLAVDRIAAVKKYKRYLNMAKFKVGVAIGISWLVALAMAFPLICGFVLSMPYRNRYSCAPADPNDDYYLIIHVMLIVVAATVAMIALVLTTSVTFHKERKRQKKVKGNQTLGYFDQIMMTPYFRNEFYPAVFVGLAVISYLILWLPFVGVSTIGPMATRHWANESEEEASTGDAFNRYFPVQKNGFRMTRAMLDEGELQRLNTTNITSEVNTTNFDINSGIIPEIIDTPTYETVFVWFRFVFDLVVPILVFSILKDVKAKSEGLVMCCRPNSVTVASPKPIRPYLNRMPSVNAAEQKEKSGQSQKQKNSKKSVGFKTPILFATSDGLHIRTVEETYLDMIENKPLIGFNKQNNEAPRFSYGLCDVMLGFEELTDFDGQYHIDDRYENEPQSDIGSSNPIVEAAERAAIGQKPLKEPLDYDSDDIPVQREVRPPTPPKVQIKGNDPAINLGDTVEPNYERNRRNTGKKKNVRFAPVISEEIPRPNTGDSSVLDTSIASDRSSDSGIMADNERSSARGTFEKPKPRFVPNKDRKRIVKRPPGKPPIHRNGGIGGPSRRPPRAVGGPKKTVGAKIRNIKSRHFSKISASLTSLEENPPQPKPRRFSKPSS